MNDLTLDEILNIMLIIFGIILLIMPLFFNGFQNKEDIKDKKGRLLRVDLKGLNAKGKILITICFLSLCTGVWKAIREDNSKAVQNGDTQFLKDKITTLTGKIDSDKISYVSLFKRDSLQRVMQINYDNGILQKVQSSLRSNGFGITKTFQIVPINNSSVVKLDASNGGHISHISFGTITVNEKKLKPNK
ncbi:hypothetical protein [Mucilaginibacter sp.]|uniref:hypothetical protein n=1 Tax=Mucilaginibacter sp. TaxID=1882438 RepID=UPI002629B763|nr:hypothetical protein [Mucilaginibacter sp.]